jgi:hypothetical protein
VAGTYDLVGGPPAQAESVTRPTRIARSLGLLEALAFVWLVPERVSGGAGAEPPTATRENVAVRFLRRVDSLDEVIGRLDGVPVLVPRRSMSYGADEIVVRSPSGHVVGLAQHAKKDG